MLPPRRATLVLAVLALVSVLAACSGTTHLTALHPRRAAAAGPAGLSVPTVDPVGTPSTAVTRPLLHLPVTPAGQRPPQFVVVSFDGSGGRPLWKYWRSVTTKAGAHATFFLSGVYLLTPQARLAYHPPKHPAGYSDIGFGITPNGSNPPAEIQALLANLSSAYLAGDEIGTHFNGHFCTPYAGNVATWDTADWRAEIKQFDHLLADVDADNGLPNSTPALPFGPSAIIGGRTPCLEGNLPELHKAEVASGFRYDATDNAAADTWPFRQDGLWNMPLSLLPVVGSHYSTLSTDYNLYANQTAAADGPRLRRCALAGPGVGHLEGGTGPRRMPGIGPRSRWGTTLSRGTARPIRTRSRR